MGELSLRFYKLKRIQVYIMPRTCRTDVNEGRDFYCLNDNNIQILRLCQSPCCPDPDIATVKCEKEFRAKISFIN